MKIMSEVGMNGILADDMGLGKTVQTAAFIQHEVDCGVTTARNPGMSGGIVPRLP
jgi:SNF2 family DNA or RNA helicase